jgi:uncharacterized protein (DUF433 family)
MDWRSRIVADPDVLVGKPVIKGTRISVELVMDLLAAGYTTDQIIEQYDHLTRDDIQACLAYAREIVHSERVYAVKR